MKKDIIDTAKKLKEFKEDYSTRRKALVQLRDQWDLIDTTLGDPPSEAPEEWSSTEDAPAAQPPVEVVSDPDVWAPLPGRRDSGYLDKARMAHHQDRSERVASRQAWAP